MSDDVQREMAAFAAWQQSRQKGRDDMTAAWRRLRAFHAGLEREIAGRRGAVRETDPDVLFGEMRDTYAVQLSQARQAAKKADAAVEEYTAKGGVLERLSPAWRAERVRREAAAIKANDEADAMLAEERHRHMEYRATAAAKARENVRANAADLQRLGPLGERLTGLEYAMRAIEAGDRPAVACLMRWDVDALVKVARIWRYIRAYGKVGEADWDYYCSAGRPAVTVGPFGAGGDAPPPPRAAAGDEGTVVRVAVAPDGRMAGLFKSEYRGTPAGASFASVGILPLAEILGSLRMDGLSADADMVEAWLDTAIPDWRNQVEAALNGGADGGTGGNTQSATPPPPSAEDPHDVLGVTLDTPMDQVAAAFRAMMQAVEHLPNAGSPQRRLIAAFKAVKAARRDDGQ